MLPPAHFLPEDVLISFYNKKGYATCLNEVWTGRFSFIKIKWLQVHDGKLTEATLLKVLSYKLSERKYDEKPKYSKEDSNMADKQDCGQRCFLHGQLYFQVGFSKWRISDFLIIDNNSCKPLLVVESAIQLQPICDDPIWFSRQEDQQKWCVLPVSV